MLSLKEITQSELAIFHQLQKKAFRDLYEKYQDTTTNPACETYERLLQKFQEENTKIFFILLNNQPIGGIRIRLLEDRNSQKNRISPLFILPAYNNRGYGQLAIGLLEKEFSATDSWHLSTIKEETKLIHFYQKLGYAILDEEQQVQEQMTIIHLKKTKELGG